MPMPMPMPKPVCIIRMYNKIVQLEACRTFSGRGTGINGTAQCRLQLPVFRIIMIMIVIRNPMIY